MKTYQQYLTNKQAREAVLTSGGFRVELAAQQFSSCPVFFLLHPVRAVLHEGTAATSWFALTLFVS